MGFEPSYGMYKTKNVFVSKILIIIYLYTGTKTVVRTRGKKEAFSSKRKREKKNGHAEQGNYICDFRM